MGPAPLTHTEIAAWQGLTGAEMEPWEVTALIRLSFDYLSESQAAADPKKDAPEENSGDGKMVRAILAFEAAQQFLNNGAG